MKEISIISQIAYYSILLFFTKWDYFLKKILLLLCFIGFLPSLIGQSSCLDMTITNLQCQADATPNNPFDDTYTFTLEITGGSSGWKSELADLPIIGSYGNAITVGPFAVADGPMFLLVQDTLDATCNNGQTIIPPVCVSCNNTAISICAGESVELMATARNLWGSANYTSFQWYKEEIVINGATDSLLTANASGRYTLRASNNLTPQNASCYEETCCNFTINIAPDLIATNDLISSNCPGLGVLGNVSQNDLVTNGVSYSLVTNPVGGTINFDNTGFFSYVPFDNVCTTDQFSYQICSAGGTCCDTAMVFLNIQDTIAPTIINIPLDDTIHCDEQLLVPPLITALDNCPAISINVEEKNTQGEDGCSLHDYELTRIWTATDICGNTAVDSQQVKIRDITAPDIFRIYTLPNGKKMVAGVMENVNQNWKTISLPIDFPTTPLIFSQVITTKENTPITTRIRNVSVSQFELKLQEEEGEDNRHIRESVAWIAIEEGNQTTGFPLETQRISLMNAWKTVNFNTNYTVFPSFFGQMQTINDSDPAALRFRNPNLNNVQVQIEEEASLNPDVSHQSEEIAFMGIEHGVDMVNEKGHVFGETGSVSVDERWITVTTTQTYYNPVVLAGVPQHIGGDPGVVRIRNVTANSFDIQFQEWNYRDGGHTFEYVSYLVMEGSLPLDASIICEYGTDSLEIGKDILAIDNCDINIDLQYEETAIIDGNAKQIIRTWYAVDECGNATGLSQIVPCKGVGLKLKALLQGAMLGNNNAPLMRDDLRKKGLLPTKEPYAILQSFDHVGAGGGEACLPEMFDIIGKKAIVDWVFVALKQADNQAVVVATCSALLQRDGRVITANGDSILYFNNLPPDNYYVSIRHRNHLKVATLHPYLFNESNIPFIDFTYNFLPTTGNEAFTESAGGNALWSGDLNQDEKTIYQGPQNDVFRMFLEVLLDSLNQNYLTNFINRGYTENDFNLDGLTIYQGPNNDRSNLLFNTILAHPSNDIKASNFILSTRDKIENLENCQTDNTLSSCDFDGDGKLNQTDSDDDNDGVIDGNDVNPYNSESDSDADGIEDKIETENGTNPLNACDPYQDHIACEAQDLDEDGQYGNYPVGHNLYDENDLDACMPNPNASNCGCPDEDGDGYIYINHTTNKGQNQLLKITIAQWRLRQAIGDVCTGF